MISKIYKGEHGDLRTEERGAALNQEIWDFLIKKTDPRKETDAFVMAYNMIAEEKNLKDPEYLLEMLKIQEEESKKEVAEKKAQALLDSFLKKK